MVQPIDSNIAKPNYNAVKINIKKPEVNAGNSNMTNSITNNNGTYNAVNIEIDNPTVNTEPTKKIYDYPTATEPVYFDMLDINPTLPKDYSFAYQTTNIILPKLENEVELKDLNKSEDLMATDKDFNDNTNNEEVLLLDVTDNKDELVNEYNNDEKTIPVPLPNYTTVEEEKEMALAENLPKDIEDTSKTQLNFRGVEKKTPEIIPAEDIKPDIDIPLVISNLRNDDYDIQAQQMEEIARISLDKKENVVPYLVRDVFVSLIDITKKDTSKLETPSMEQIQARKKIIANFMAIESANKDSKLQVPFEVSDKDLELANNLSPMEQAERNKEYALYTISVLAKTYADEIEKKTGDIVPMTDLPGSAAIVDALRYNPNSGVKIAAIDSLRHIQRPEYKEELATLYTLAKADPNPQVSYAATNALAGLSQQ